MNRKIRKDRDYPVLASALKSLRQNEFAKFYNVYGRFQIGWGIFASNDEWSIFRKWMRPHVDNLIARRITYRSFRDQLAEYIDRMTDPRMHEKLIVLARETYNCRDEWDLYELGKELFLGDCYGKND